MTNEDYRIIEEARMFLDMMSRAYSEVWRRRFVDDPPIEPDSVLAIYDDCEFYRARLASILCKKMGKNLTARSKEDLFSTFEIHQHLDASWRSLYVASIGKVPRYIPPRVQFG